MVNTKILLVTAKVNPDLDGTACSLAYSDLLNQTEIISEGIVTGSYQSEVKYFTNKRNIHIPTRVDDESDTWKEFVLVDASSMKGMPKVVQADKVIEIIDHRTGEPEKEFPNAKIQNELIGAAATLVVEIFIKAHKNIKEDHAKLLYGAIYHNTLNFIATNTTQRDKDAVKFLETNFKLSNVMIREMFEFATLDIIKNVSLAIENDAKEFVAGPKVGAYQLVVWGDEIFKQYENLENSAIKLRNKMGSDWFYLNVIDIESKKSHIFVSGVNAINIMEKALGIKFENGWALQPAILRKQIMSKINDEVN